jgi:hypothetical protein
VMFNNNRIANVCDGFSLNRGAYSVVFGGSNSDITAVGNDLTGGGNTGVTNGTPIGASVANNNTNIDTVIGSVASATTITAPINPVFSVTGSTTVATINSWVRSFTMLANSGITFTGGNICNGPISSSGPINAYWNGTCWALK